MLALRDLLLIAALLGAVAVPYACEWWFFKRRLGLFGLLFWFYAGQWLLLLVVVQLSIWTTGPGETPIAWLTASAATAWLFIGVIPYVVEPVAIVAALTVLVARRFGAWAKVAAQGGER